MRKGRAPIVVLLFGALLAACGATGSAAAGPDSKVPCPPADFAMRGAVDVPALCRRIVALADERLGLLHWPVSDVQLRWDLCAPNMRCLAFVQLSEAWVLYRFSFGDPVMIHVGPRVEGNVVVDELVAGAPEPLPAWLLDELEGGPTR